MTCGSVRQLGDTYSSNSLKDGPQRAQQNLALSVPYRRASIYVGLPNKRGRGGSGGLFVWLISYLRFARTVLRMRVGARYYGIKCGTSHIIMSVHTATPGITPQSASTAHLNGTIEPGLAPE